MSDPEKGEDPALATEVEGGDGAANVNGTGSGPLDDESKEEKESDAKEEDAAKKYADWPLKNISEPHDHDVLFGRGGGTNHHPGNKRYRQMVEDRKLDYVNSKRLDKPLVALEIIKVWRAQAPPGRFLKLDEKTGMWNDVGDKKAREKTSQALREKAPLIRKQQEEERMSHEKGNGDMDEGGAKTTRFAEGTKDGRATVRRPGLARDTSLGPLAADEQALEGFSWREGIGSNEGNAAQKEPAPGPPPQTYPQSPYPPHPAAQQPPAHYRYPSHGSMGSLPPYPPPPQGPYIPTNSDDRRMQFASQSGRFESWGSLPPHGGPPPPMPAHIHSSGGPMISGGRMQSGGSWGAPEPGVAREHSLGSFPLPHASIGHPAPYTPFEGRHGSGHFAPPYPPGHPAGPPQYGAPPYHYSNGAPPPPPPASPGGYHHPGQPTYGHRRSSSNSHSVDPALAAAWTQQPQSEIENVMSSEDPDSTKPSPSPRHDMMSMKPDIIKRATSNQNETPDAKPDRVGGSVKRAALNRDSSRAANRLKEICFPGQFSNGTFDAAHEVSELSKDMGRSTLNTDFPSQVGLSDDDRKTTLDYLPPINDDDVVPRPGALDEGGRMTSLDLVAMDLAIKPKAIGTTSRTTSTTIEGLALDAVDDVLLSKPEVMDRTTTMEAVMADLEKPGAIKLDGRLTTSDFISMVNEPIADDDPLVFTGKRQEV